jgi:hypothetical protein
VPIQSGFGYQETHGHWRMISPRPQRSGAQPRPDTQNRTPTRCAELESPPQITSLRFDAALSDIIVPP